jgi:cell wall-associated NlpC family hydrolase
MSSTSNHAICTVPVLPMRSSAAHGSEMVSELIFGECFEIIKTQGAHWHRVQSVEDGYQGWCFIRHPVWVDEAIFQTTGEGLTGDWISTVQWNGQPLKVPLGSRLKGLRSGKAVWGGIPLSFSGTLIPAAKQVPVRDSIRDNAMQYLNSSYVWGGKTVFGLDCSGFTQSLYRLIGTRIPRDASAQYGEGEPVDIKMEPQYGDLAFFNQGSGKPTHVGILLDGNNIMHCAEKVRIDTLGPEGIHLAETDELTHKLIGVRRYFRLKED